MAQIVLGVGTSHSSQLSLAPEDWAEQGDLDKSRTPWGDLIQKAPPSRAAELRPETIRERHDRAQEALRTLATAIEDCAPDVLLIVGDDQRELFEHDCVPAIAMALTDGMYDLPPAPESLDPIRKKALWAFHAEEAELYPFAVGLSEHVAAELTSAGFDLTILRAQPPQRTLGHAWTFIRRRLLSARQVPMVPIFLNTYFGPNRPTPARCVELGTALAKAVRSYPEPLRVGMIASGGLSHFVVDEALDYRIIDELKNSDIDALAAEDPALFTSGTSEILNWITVGAAMRERTFSLVDYIPAYRSMAGTGVGFAFGIWEP
jgi:3-O-methylgallate 3,4-dioxygenase